MIDYGVYYITDRASLHPDYTLYLNVMEALEAGIGVLQYREKNMSTAEMFEEALWLRNLCKERGVPFIVNDRADLALAVDADGVHVGPNDLPVEEVRRIIGPDKILGASANTLERAIACQKAGADYLGVGTLFETETKMDTRPVGAELLSKIRQAVSIPIVGIGGIHQHNLSALHGSGLDGIAVVSEISSSPHVRETVRSLRAHVPMLRGSRLLIVDGDGVLIDSHANWSQLLKDFCDAHGYPFERVNLKTMWDLSFEEGVVYLGHIFGRNLDFGETMEELMALAVPYYQTVSLHDGVMEWLQERKEEGCRLIFATAMSERIMELERERFGFDSVFDECMSTMFSVNGKRSSEFYEETAKRYGCRTRDILLIEDDLEALMAAKRAGASTLWIGKTSEADSEALRFCDMNSEFLRKAEFRCKTFWN